MSEARLDTVVADTCALVSLAIPRADATYDATTAPDPLQYLLTGCSVQVPSQVVDELREMAQFDDVQAAAASNVLAADGYYATEDPLDSTDAPESLPEHGLDAGETAGILLANAHGVDAFLTDEFTNLARIRALLDGPMAVPTPRLVRDYARAGQISETEARTLFDVIAPHRSWAGNAYVDAIRDRL